MVDIQFKYGANNVPRISDTEIERHAMLFIQDYNTDLLKIPQPLDVTANAICPAADGVS